MAVLAVTCPEKFLSWGPSGYLIVLSTRDELALRQLADRLPASVGCARFHEPDFGGELTAVAVFDTPELSGRLSSLPLAFSDPQPLHNALCLRRERNLRNCSRS